MGSDAHGTFREESDVLTGMGTLMGRDRRGLNLCVGVNIMAVLSLGGGPGPPGCHTWLGSGCLGVVSMADRIGCP